MDWEAVKTQVQALPDTPDEFKLTIQRTPASDHIMLLSKPLKEITFEDIVEFCKQWPEGVRIK